ncbi:MAG TPA: beta-ketoacyl-[acyl-carrier-protein] synthase family protein, partial [Myxococcaceae bacterium]|nr:beta-ketoacyl-[acyl-carrier-protein] synthase family protein [Myxococcaceae bacterium]
MKTWLGLVREELSRLVPEQERESLDRTALLALKAAHEAWREAGLDGADGRPESSRLGLTFGTSHGGRSQYDRFIEEGSDVQREGAAERLLVRAAHHSQAEAVARALGLRGPVLTVSSACSSGANAIAHACALLRAGKADVILAGGADAFSELTCAGFQSLKAMADGPSSPFSSRIGLSLGEGSGFVVLETLEHARRRGAEPLAELLGYGLSWDAHHLTEPDPMGSGVLRAFTVAAGRAWLEPGELDYVHAHGTGTHANDGAESLALRRFFQPGECPPVSATKSFTGHTLGASAVLGLIFAILGMRRGFLPPTVNFEGPRPGCALDYVPNEARRATIRHFAVDASGFGGTNAVLVGGLPTDARPGRRRSREEVLITGLGTVSPIGCGREAFLEGLRTGRRGLEVRDFEPRRLVPTLAVRRLDRLMQFATAAVYEALGHAGLGSGAIPAERLGLVVGTTRGAVASFEKYLASVRGASWQRASPVSFPNLVMSSIGGQVSQALGIKGAASTLVNGTTSGLHALVHACELLRDDDSLEALVVVAGDELNGLYRRLFERQGWLDAGGMLRPYDPEAGGLVLGEGAVALVLERSSSVRARGAPPLAAVRGAGLTADARGAHRMEPEGRGLERAMRLALEEAGLEAGAVDVA